MNVEEALSKIHSPKGMTSVIEGVLTGDFDSIRSQDATNASLTEARAKLESIQKTQAECKSDAAYWGYEGDAAYWRAVVSILEAAVITGPENLPDIEAPNTEGRVVMDACSLIEKYGKAILSAAQKADVPEEYRSQSPEQALSHVGEELGELIEAAGRLVAAIGKTQRFGPASVNPGLPPEQQETNFEWVRREMADVERSIVEFRKHTAHIA